MTVTCHLTHFDCTVKQRMGDMLATIIITTLLTANLVALFDRFCTE